MFRETATNVTFIQKKRRHKKCFLGFKDIADCRAKFTKTASLVFDDLKRDETHALVSSHRCPGGGESVNPRSPCRTRSGYRGGSGPRASTNLIRFLPRKRSESGKIERRRRVWSPWCGHFSPEASCGGTRRCYKISCPPPSQPRSTFSLSLPDGVCRGYFEENLK